MADLARFIDRNTMEHVRVYPHPIERVWRAIIEPEEFGVWFIKGRLDARVGGRFWFGDHGFQGVVQAIEPPRLLRLGDDKGDSFQYDLSEAAGGTRMQFVHHIPAPSGPSVELPDPTGPDEWDYGGDLPGGLDTPWRPGFIGGFHDMFDQLTDFLDGVPLNARLPTTPFSRFVEKWARSSPGMGELTPGEIEERGRAYRALRSRERWFDLIKIYRAHVKATIPPPDAKRDG
jgi:uncharacterized protein YndB with AHSA1/START domain